MHKNIFIEGRHKSVRYSMRSYWSMHVGSTLYELARHVTSLRGLQKERMYIPIKYSIIVVIDTAVVGKGTLQESLSSSRPELVSRWLQQCRQKQHQWWCKSDATPHQYSSRLHRVPTVSVRLMSNRPHYAVNAFGTHIVRHSLFRVTFARRFTANRVHNLKNLSQTPQKKFEYRPASVAKIGQQQENAQQANVHSR